MPLATDEETAILKAVRDRVREVLSLPSSSVDVELDDYVPAIAGDKHVVIVPNGWTAGPNARNSTTIDNYLNVRVVVFNRIGNIPRDRRRDVFLGYSEGINKDLLAIRNGVEFSYDVVAKANTFLGASAGEGFIEPLRFGSVDPKPQTVDEEPFTAAAPMAKASHNQLAIKRGINFVLARFCRVSRA